MPLRQATPCLGPVAVPQFPWCWEAVPSGPQASERQGLVALPCPGHPVRPGFVKGGRLMWASAGEQSPGAPGLEIGGSNIQPSCWPPSVRAPTPPHWRRHHWACRLVPRVQSGH